MSVGEAEEKASCVAGFFSAFKMDLSTPIEIRPAQIA